MTFANAIGGFTLNGWVNPCTHVS